MPVDLPPDLKGKLAIVRRRHNRVAMFAPLVMAAAMLAFIWYGPKGHLFLGGFVAFLVAATVDYIIWLCRYDAALCREVGLLCPYCSKPLYQGGPNDFSLYGRCPKCKRDVAKPETLHCT